MPTKQEQNIRRGARQPEKLHTSQPRICETCCIDQFCSTNVEKAKFTHQNRNFDKQNHALLQIRYSHSSHTSFVINICVLSRSP
mmetsp:Transcript_32038/g.71987  ORF Transcript_32038/g.71987 Transcript_32038/m.71987 type:complete len:84 (-) Transcript_32038:469-720(-)